MAAQVLHTELASLVQESKKKYPDLRNVPLPIPYKAAYSNQFSTQAAESSLNELKALPNTSEAQLAAG